MSEPSRPWVTKAPAVGTVTRDRIFRRVLLPAPFIPISPNTSPRLSEKLTSRRAQNSSRGWTVRPSRRAVRRPTSSLIEVTCQPWRSLYRLETPERWMALSDIGTLVLSDHVCKSAFGALEYRERQAGNDNGDGEAGAQAREVWGGAQDKRPAVAVDDGGHWIEQIKRMEPAWNHADGIGNGSGEHPELDDEREPVTDVTEVDVGGRGQADHAEGQHDLEQEQRDDPQGSQGERDLVVEEQTDEEQRGHSEVKQSCQEHRDQEGVAREIDLPDQGSVRHQGAGSAGDGVRKEGPENKSAVGEDWIGDAVAGHLGKEGEDQGEDDHHGERLEQSPGDAEHALLVAGLDVAHGEARDQVPVLIEVRDGVTHGASSVRGGGGAGGEPVELGRGRRSIARV